MTFKDFREAIKTDKALFNTKEDGRLMLPYGGVPTSLVVTDKTKHPDYDDDWLFVNIEVPRDFEAEEVDWHKIGSLTYYGDRPGSYRVAIISYLEPGSYPLMRFDEETLVQTAYMEPCAKRIMEEFYTAYHEREN